MYTLNANCVALINPSFFEGWSTTVEEAKSLGTKMILSNIELHKEQAKEAMFFDPKKIDSFQDIILKFISNQGELSNYRDLNQIQKYSEIRKIEYSEAIHNAFKFES